MPRKRGLRAASVSDAALDAGAIVTAEDVDDAVRQFARDASRAGRLARLLDAGDDAPDALNRSPRAPNATDG